MTNDEVPKYPRDDKTRMTKSPVITIYRPNMRHELGFFETWAVMMRNVWGAARLDSPNASGVVT